MSRLVVHDALAWRSIPPDNAQLVLESWSDCTLRQEMAIIILIPEADSLERAIYFCQRRKGGLSNDDRNSI